MEASRPAIIKIFLQIPCRNEELSLPTVLCSLAGLKLDTQEVTAKVEILVIDDGSSDRTLEVAKRHAIEHVLSLPEHKGLCAAFQCGLDYCLGQGADIIVNIDADNQYCGHDIPRLIEPLLAHRADMVIGARNMESISEFSWLKRKLQRLGSFVVSQLAGVAVPDVTSGFRALNRKAAQRLALTDPYTYTLESIFQAANQDLKVAHIEIETNPSLRPSRLVRSMQQYVVNSIGTMSRLYVVLNLPRILKALFLSYAFIVVVSTPWWWQYCFSSAQSDAGAHVISALVVFTGLLLLLAAWLLATLLDFVRRLTVELLARAKGSKF